MGGEQAPGELGSREVLVVEKQGFVLLGLFVGLST